MRGWAKLVCALALTGSMLCVSATISQPARPQPWIEPQDSASAITDPDAYAWRLFVAVNWPSDPTTGQADSQKALGADGPVVWERWKNAPDVFLPKGADPGPWVPQPLGPMRSIQSFDLEPLQQQLLRRETGAAAPTFDPVAAENEINETRLNRATYEFIRTNELYHLQGQVKLFQTGAETVSFPLGAKETKAQWRVITAADKPRYHWVAVTGANGQPKIYGLTALHITTKDLPNWFWATFEHVDNPTRPGNEPWAKPSHDTFACKGAKPDCNKAPSGIGLEGTKWENYRLRGTQIDFTDSRGRPTILANSQPEAGFQTSSSCITCHARASIGLQGSQPRRLSIFAPGGAGHVGAVDPAWFKTATGGSAFTQLDFVWSMMRAQPKQP